MDSLPKYHETFLPVLKSLQDGKIISYSDMRKLVRDTYFSNLSEEALAEKTKAGDQLILNRIGWAKAYLKQAGLLEQPERGMVQITQKGKEFAQREYLSLEDVLNDPVFLSHRKVQRMKSEVAEGISTSASPQDLVDTGVQEIEEQTKGELLERLKKVDPYYFERVVLELFKKMGYGDYVETAKSGDGGIDGIINQDQLGIEKIYTQAKRYSEKKVHETDIRNFIGAMSGGTNKGIFVTTSEFDENAVKKARESHHNTIVLIDGFQLVDLMYKFGVGVQIKNIYEIKEIDEDFFEAE